MSALSHIARSLIEATAELEADNRLAELRHIARLASQQLGLQHAEIERLNQAMKGMGPLDAGMPALDQALRTARNEASRLQRLYGSATAKADRYQREVWQPLFLGTGATSRQASFNRASCHASIALEQQRAHGQGDMYLSGD